MVEAPSKWILRFTRELRRRKVYTAAAAYVGLSLVLLEGGGALFEAFRYENAKNIMAIILALGFPVILVMAWIFDMGPGGVHRTETVEALPSSDADASQAQSMDPAAGPPRVERSAVAPTVGSRPPYSPGLTPPPPLPVAAASAGEVPAEAEQPPEPDRVRRVALTHARHELRTPINAILGYSEMLLEDVEESGASDDAADLGRIRAGGRELLALVDGILDPERIAHEAGTDLDEYGKRIRADLRTPVTAVIGYAEMLLEGGDPAMAADLERILGAARHLLELSEDIVGLATGGHAPGSGDLDQAAALAEGVLAKVLPLQARPVDAAREGSLLVVDDNPTNRDLISRQLARTGFMVATASSGAEALERMGDQAFDLVLLDILMPDMDGLEVLRRMKADAGLAEMPVIMLSSLDEIDSAIRCLEAGASDYVTKPFHPRLLEARITAVMAVRRLREREAWFRARAEDGDAHLHRLLRGACPPGLAHRLRQGETSIMEPYPDAAVAWCNLERALGGARTPPEQRVAAAEQVLAAFEGAAEAAGLNTVLLQPPAVILGGGIGIGNDEGNAALRVAEAAMAGMEACVAGLGPAAAQLRMGLHVGEAWGAVFAGDRIGVHLWGEALDLARRLERQATPGTIHVSPAGQAALRGGFVLTSRGVVDISGRGQLRTFTLERRLAQHA